MNDGFQLKEKLFQLYNDSTGSVSASSKSVYLMAESKLEEIDGWGENWSKRKVDFNEAQMIIESKGKYISYKF